jgi:hypothetical protein
MEFSDMSKVYDVDAKVIERTQRDRRSRRPGSSRRAT